MKLKIEIKNRFTGKVLFEYENENNTIKDTLVKAVERDAYLRGAYLQDAYLQGAYLRGAYLQGADLQGAYLQGADLRGAYLQGADLQGADLRGAYLQDADLRGADLRGAYLQGADLRGAYLQDADLQGADLQGAYLQDADLRGAEIKSAIVFTGLYTYLVIPYITKENEKRIKMGCYDRSLQEWESDFWNNNNEFPNDGSLKSNQRLLAYETAKKWLELSAEDIKNKELAEQEV
jgi:hypothetical protein